MLNLEILDKMFQFELHPLTGEIRTKFLVYDKGGVIKHVKAFIVVFSRKPKNASVRV